MGKSKPLGGTLKDDVMSTEEFVNHITERIEEEIKKQGMKKSHFAEKLGKDASWLNNKLVGRRKMTLQDLYLIAQGLGFSGVEEFFPVRYQKSLWEMMLENIFESIVKSELERKLEEHIRNKHRIDGEVEEMLERERERERERESKEK